MSSSIVNLTIPAVHAQVSGQAIEAGKHVWSEKPISVDRASGRELLAKADAAGLLVGIAPDTVLGPGVQTARRAIARGDIGEPLSAQTVMQYIGPDIFHPSPEFLFAKGAGPLFDMGPYYLTTLVHVFGSVGVCRGGRLEEPRHPDHPGRRSRRHDVRGGGADPRQRHRLVRRWRRQPERVQLRLADGQDGRRRDHRHRRDPGDPGPEHLHGRGQDHPRTRARPRSWTRRSGRTCRSPGCYAERGLGVLDLARAARTGGRPLASGELGFHVLDTMVAIDESITARQVVPVQSRVTPIPLVSEEFNPFVATF